MSERVTLYIVPGAADWGWSNGRRTVVCRACTSRGMQDGDDIACVACGRRLASLTPLLSRAQVDEELAAEAGARDAEQCREAARSRWSGQAGRCRKGHEISGENALKWRDQARCRQCYFARHSACPAGHPYVTETTMVRSDGRRLCLVEVEGNPCWRTRLRRSIREHNESKAS